MLVFGSTEVADTGNYTCVADQATQTVLLIVSPGDDGDDDDGDDDGDDAAPKDAFVFLFSWHCTGPSEPLSADKRFRFVLIAPSKLARHSSNRGRSHSQLFQKILFFILHLGWSCFGEFSCGAVKKKTPPFQEETEQTNRTYVLISLTYLQSPNLFGERNISTQSQISQCG